MSSERIVGVSVVIPAFDEEAILPTTLAAVQEATASLRDLPAEIVVVDNGSRDGTAMVARRLSAIVVEEPVQNISRARNRGASRASGEYLVFLDADVSVPADLLTVIASELDDPSCVGGGFEIRYRPGKRLARAYLAVWRTVGRLVRAVQGGVQFCRRDDFWALGGYDETLWMGEDVDFYWRMHARARSSGGRVAFLERPPVEASARRFDQWSVLRTMVYTNPVFAGLLGRRRRTWSGWYDDPPR